MKGVIVEQQGSQPKLVDNLDVPEPGEDQILVKAVWAAVNPVESYMVNYGILVAEYPWILGCDIAGTVTKAGSKAVNVVTGKPFKEGDAVCGCTRLGYLKYGAFQEHLLMDARLAIPKPSNVDFASAATIGVGSETACLGVFNGMGIDVPKDVSQLPTHHGEWALVFGGAGSVGKYAIQLLKALGLKVATTCSPSSASLVSSLGADVTLDYKKPQEQQLQELLEKTDNKVYRIYDATGQSQDFAQAIFGKVAGSAKAEGSKMYFTTTNDLGEHDDAAFHGARFDGINLGLIGRPDAPKVNELLESYIPVIVNLIENGKVKTNEYEVKGHGLEDVLEAFKYQTSGKAGNKKVLVKLGDA